METSFLRAAMLGDLEQVKDFLQDAEASANINHRDQLGRTALMWASSLGHLLIVEALLAHRALVNLENDLGETALDYAKIYGHPEIVAHLEKAHGRYTKAAKR